MNKIYRSVWNEALGTWVAAPENARTCKKSGRSPRLALLAPAALAIGMGTSFMSADALAACSGGSQSTSFGNLETCEDTDVLDVTTTGVFNSQGHQFLDDSILNLNIADAITTASQRLLFKDNSVINANVTGAINGTHSSGLNLENNSTLYANAETSVKAAIKLSDNASIIVGADNPFGAGTTLTFNSSSGGTLDLNGYNTTVGGLASTVTNSGLITNNGASDAVLTLSGGVGNFDGLIQDGSSVLSLKVTGAASLLGTGTFTGGTEISGSGSLDAYASALGSGNVTISEYARLNLLNNDTSTTAVFSNNITGDGSLFKYGLGTVELTGTNTHAKATDVSAGTLIAPIAALGASNARIIVDPSATLIIKSNATGSSDLTHEFPTSTFPSNNGGQIIFDVDAGKSINALTPSLHSQNAIEKTGLGDLYLNNDYRQLSFHINQGSLTMDPAAVANIIDVNSGGRLAGSGSAANVNVNAGGVLAPSLGSILSVVNLKFDPNSTYVVTAADSDAANSSSHVQAAVNAELNGAAVQVEAQNGTWESDRSYTILYANNISGTFSGATANFAYLSPTLTYTANEVELTLTRTTTGGNNPGNGGNTPGNGGNTPGNGGNTPNPGGSNPGGNNPGNGGTPITFASLAQTANQRGVANSVESLPSNHEVYNFVETLPVGAPPAVFNSLSGEAHASILSGLPQVSRHAVNLPLDNMRTTLNAGLNPVAMTAQVGGTLGSSGLPATTDKPAWVQLVGNWQDVDGDSNTADLDQHSGGVFVGYDNEIANGWYLGGSLGYTDTDSSVSDRRSDAEISSYSATVYGGKAFALDTQRQLNVMAGLSYTLHDVETERDISGLEQKLKADYDVSTTQLFGEVGYVIGQPDKQYIEPFAGLTVTYLDADGFTERGGSAALKGKGETDTQTVSTLGLRAQTGYNLGNNAALLRGSLAWQHAFEDERMERTLAFRDGSDAFAVKGVALARDTAVLGLGTQVEVSPTAAVSLDYEGKFASGLTDHGASVKVHWSF